MTNLWYIGDYMIGGFLIFLLAMAVLAIFMAVRTAPRVYYWLLWKSRFLWPREIRRRMEKDMWPKPRP